MSGSRILLGSDWITLQTLKDLTLEPIGDLDVSCPSDPVTHTVEASCSVSLLCGHEKKDLWLIFYNSVCLSLPLLCVCVCVCERERERERERELKSPGMVSNGCDPLKLHCDPLGFQQPNLHTKFKNP